MIDVPVSTVMREDVPVVSPADSAVDAAGRLRDPSVPALVVVDGGDIVGIVTESDIVAVLAERGDNPAVEAFMSRPVVTVVPRTSVGSAAQRMRNAGVTILPVVGENSLVGLVTRDTIAPYLARHHMEITWDGDPLRLSTAEAVEVSSQPADE